MKKIFPASGIDNLISPFQSTVVLSVDAINLHLRAAALLAALARRRRGFQLEGKEGGEGRGRGGGKRLENHRGISLISPALPYHLQEQDAGNQSDEVNSLANPFRDRPRSAAGRAELNIRGDRTYRASTSH